MESAEQNDRIRGILLFDGECGLCTYFARLAKVIDSLSDFIIVPYQLMTADKLADFGLSHEKCARKIQLISSDGHVHSGAFAINYFLLHHFPWAAFVISIYSFPPLLLAEILLYEGITKTRNSLSRLLRLKPAIVNSKPAISRQ